MSSDMLFEQAEVLTKALPKLIRCVSALDDDPAAELPLAQIRSCSILVEGPQPMGHLSKELGISLSAVTQLADRLEKAGMIERVSESDDRRTKLLRLTERGMEVMVRRRNRRIERARQLLECVPEESRESVRESLEVLMKACEQMKSCGCVGMVIEDA